MFDFLKKPWVMVTLAVIVAIWLESRFGIFARLRSAAGGISSTVTTAPVVKQ